MSFNFTICNWLVSHSSYLHCWICSNSWLSLFSTKFAPKLLPLSFFNPLLNRLQFTQFVDTCHFVRVVIRYKFASCQIVLKSLRHWWLREWIYFFVNTNCGISWLVCPLIFRFIIIIRRLLSVLVVVGELCATILLGYLKWISWLMSFHH